MARLKKPKTRAEMIAFLSGHFRYDTMNSWNAASSYAQNVKIHRGDWVPRKLMDRAWEILEQGDVYEEIRQVLDDWGRENGWHWQAGFNGRSSGYIVMYMGGSKDSQHKSWCRACGQRNFTSVKENDTTCGRCNKKERVDYEKPPREVFSWPGKGVDQGENFEEWDTDRLKDRVDLVWSFDLMVEDCKAVFLDHCRRFEVVEEEIMVPKKVKRLKEVA